METSQHRAKHHSNGLEKLSSIDKDEGLLLLSSWPSSVHCTEQVCEFEVKILVVAGLESTLMHHSETSVISGRQSELRNYHYSGESDLQNQIGSDSNAIQAGVTTASTAVCGIQPE